MRIKNKIIITIVLFLGIIILNNNISFADEVDLTNIHTYVQNNCINDDYNAYTIFSTDSSKCYVMIFNKNNCCPCYCNKSSEHSIGLYSPSSLINALYLLNFYYSSSSPSNTRTLNYSSSYQKIFNNWSYPLNILYSTVDVYNSTNTQVIISSTPIYFEGDEDFYNTTIYYNTEILIDDQNLKKRFKFNLNIPKDKDDTKYFIFLDEYTRNSYNNVKADFFVYTVSTPEEYDYTDYENYLYYDSLEDKLYLPAGCTIRQYFVQALNDEIYDLEPEHEFVASRDEILNEQQMHDTGIGFLNYIPNIGLVSHFLRFGLSSFLDNYNNLSLDILFPTNLYCIGFNQVDCAYQMIDGLGVSDKKLSLEKILNFAGYNSLEDGLYYTIVNMLYYGDSVSPYNFKGDFIAGNNSVVSYEHTRYSNNKSDYFYHLYRSTKVYDQENKYSDNCYLITYIDDEMVDEMLPEGTDSTYLTSPLFQDNENSSSGGNLVYDVRELIQGDKIVDYSKDYNPIHNDYNDEYIENIDNTDNSVINNYNTTVIEKTSDEYLLHNIYDAILDIRSYLSKVNDSVSNTTNNFTYNIRNETKYLFIPNMFALSDMLDFLKNIAANHLGLVYQPFAFILSILALFVALPSDNEIIFDIPDVNLFNKTLIPETHFSFTNYMNDLPILGTVHETYLLAVDFILLGLVINYAVKIFKEVFGNDN